MSKHYSIASYDKHLSLKVNGVMWLMFLFLLRPYVVGLMSVVNRSDKMQLINMVYSDQLSMSLSALSGIPVLLLLYAWARRAPGASSFVKKIWAKGSVLVVFSAVLNSAIVFFPLWLGTVRGISIYGWGQLFISLAVILIVYSSSYIKDCFADFPVDGEGAG